MPIDAAGRAATGWQPQLSLGYSTGNGNGPFGLGWALSVPGVARKTSHGRAPLPRRPRDPGEPADIFVARRARRTWCRSRRRTGPGALPAAHRGAVRPDRARRPTRGRLLGGARAATGCSPATAHRAADAPGLARTRRPSPIPATRARRIFAWRITETTDAFGNLHPVRVPRDSGDDPGHRLGPAAAQPHLVRRLRRPGRARRSWSRWISTTSSGRTRSPTTGPGSRSARRCGAARSGCAPTPPTASPRAVREYRFGYAQAPFNGASPADPDRRGRRRRPAGAAASSTAAADVRLHRVRAGRGAASSRSPAPGLPPRPLSDPTLALVDLLGNGLPDIVRARRHRPVLAQPRRRPLRPAPRPMPEAPPQRARRPRRAAARRRRRRPRRPAGHSRRPQAGYFPLSVRRRLEPALVPALPAGAVASTWTTRRRGWSTSTATA